MDTADGDLEFATRMIVYEMRTGIQPDGNDMALVKMGEWVFDGYAESVGLLTGLDGVSQLSRTARSMETDVAF